LDNSLISIPNNAVVNATVENLSLRQMRRQRFFVQITYDTPREKVEALAAAIKQLITDHPLTNKTNFQVRFNNFSDSSLDILVMFHLTVTDYTAELEAREEILLQIMDLAKEIGVEFAFPTQTLHVETMPTAGNSGSVGASGPGAVEVTPFVPRGSLSSQRGSASFEEPR
jgi:MscS family membrane protein